MAKHAAHDALHGIPKLYHWCMIPGERVERYCKHGFHPVNVDGEPLDRGRYNVIRKLGYGSFSTVWLAEDLHESRLVAIKIGEHESATAKHEIKMHHLVQSGFHSRCHSFEHIVQLAGSFDQHGPNGKHPSLVLEVMGPSCQSILNDPKPYVGGSQNTGHCPLWMAKKMIKGMINGVADLQACGVVQGDLHSGNVLVTVRQLTLDDVPALKQKTPSGHDPAGKPRRLDGKPAQPGAPQYMLRHMSLAPWANLDHNTMSVKIADLGGAFPTSEKHPKITTPMNLQAPEVLLGMSITEKIDIWSIGCMTYEILTGRPVFPVDFLAAEGDEDLLDETLIWHVDRLGPLPDSIEPRWHNRDAFYDDAWKKIPDYDSDDSERAHVHTGNEDHSLGTSFQIDNMHEIDSHEAKLILSMLRKCLRFEPRDRPTAQQLLKDQWVESL